VPGFGYSLNRIARSSACALKKRLRYPFATESRVFSRNRIPGALSKTMPCIFRHFLREQSDVGDDADSGDDGDSPVVPRIIEVYLWPTDIHMQSRSKAPSRCRASTALLPSVPAKAELEKPPSR